MKYELTDYTLTPQEGWEDSNILFLGPDGYPWAILGVDAFWKDNDIASRAIRAAFKEKRAVTVSLVFEV